MPATNWPTKYQFVTSLHLDPKNPRLGRETASFAPREIIKHPFEHDRAIDLASSIDTRGFRMDLEQLSEKMIHLEKLKTIDDWQRSRPSADRACLKD